MKQQLIKGDDNLWRCEWATSHAEMLRYHDYEWAHPTTNDASLFELLTIEIFSVGITKATILTQLEHYRRVFADFNLASLARFGSSDIHRCLRDPEIIRSHRKIHSVIINAKCALALIEEFSSLAHYFWLYEPIRDTPLWGSPQHSALTLSKDPKASHLSKDLRRRGWKFIGVPTAYAFMQSSGLVNDHLEGCHMHEKLETLRATFNRPQIAPLKDVKRPAKISRSHRTPL